MKQDYIFSSAEQGSHLEWEAVRSKVQGNTQGCEIYNS